jgi:hypothetical protein
MIRLLCYEPAGRVLHLTSDDLSRHVLALGSTGCGKTTGLINPALRQLIAWRASETGQKIGLLVLDPKADDTSVKIRTYAREASRLDDVMILAAEENSFYGYFSDFRRLDDVDEYARRVLFGSREMGEQNAYWTETRLGLVSSALAVMLAAGRNAGFDRVAEFLWAWFHSPESSEIKNALQFVERLLSTNLLQPATRRRLQLAVSDAQNWKNLDVRTRELHKSCMNNALRCLFSPAARDLFDESRAIRFRPADVLSGKILVASMNAVRHPDLTAMLFKALKRDYYEAVLSRVAFDAERDRLCGLVVDELPLSVMPEDTEALAILRSKGGFVLGCAQGINALDEVLGYRRRSALLANINSILYFSSREDQTDGHALLTLGFHDSSRKSADSSDVGDLQVLESDLIGTPRPICPPGALARLGTHQAYAKLANGTITQSPVWLAAEFHDSVPPLKLSKADDLAVARASLKHAADDEATKNPNAPLLLLHMHRKKIPLMLTQDVLAATWQLCRPRIHRNIVLARWGGKIGGLDSMPPCWLAGLDGWFRKNRRLASIITRVSVQSGVLWVQLETASTSLVEGPLVVSESINLFVYPSLWRPLLRPHWKQLMIDRPDLREELQSLAQLKNGKPV